VSTFLNAPINVAEVCISERVGDEFGTCDCKIR
jgi:hypothetical protein